MTGNIKIIIVGILTLAIGVAVLVGCSRERTVKSMNSNGHTKKISIVGSTTVAVPMELLIEKYKDINKDVTIELQGIGSSAGIKAVSDEIANIGMSSRNLKEEEKTKELTETIIAYDGIALVVHPSNKVSNLTKDQIKDIFEGNITNWKEVGGENKEIIVITREYGSGTRDAFEELMKLQEEKDDKKMSTIAPSALVAEGTGTILATVSSKTGSIGFVSLGFVSDTVKILSIDGIKPTTQTVVDGSFPISRPLLLITKKDGDNASKEFINFILTEEGQKIMSSQYIPVKNELR